MEGEKMEISNVFSVLADGQYEGEHDGVVSGDKSPANAEILAEITSKKNSTNSETLENYAKLPVTSGGNANFPQSSRNWADIVENDENFEQPKKRKRLLPSERASQSLPGPSRQTKTTRDSTTPRQPSCPRNTIEQIKVSRQMLAQCRSKAAAGTYDQMTYLEFSPEFTQVDYIKALENKLGKGCVVQIGKASGQILVGFERPDMAETIIEDGLMIKGALLKALPYQKKAEKITISGLPFVIEDADIIRTLRPYCQHAVDIAFIQETNVTTLDSVEDLCLGYRAAVVPASGARGSGLACIFSSGVQVIGQQVLSPGKIAAFDVTIRGSKATFVNCHLSHAPDERLQQLQVIAAAAVNEDAWVLGDLNISEESASDIASGSVEALGELLDRANLVDAAAIFDATHLPTRISSCGSRVDASRLDRVLIPSSFSNRVTRYWSLYYKNSDHRAVLLQTGEASEPRPPCIASMLRSRLVVGTVETLLDEALGNIEDMRNAEIWRRWGHIKAHLASAIKSLHDLRNNDDDYISRARKYVQAKLEDVSIYSDYPSLPDLGRAFRLRRMGTSSNTFYDSAGRMITGPAVRELAFVNLKERFSHPSCSPEDIDGFLRGFTLRVTIEESDPLHRYGIGEEEIVAAIGRLPTGKAAGWDDLPCELFRGFEDYFASALRRVFEASQLCGALPTSMRRSEMSLIEKPHGGPGLAGLRPLSLPTTDYRVLSGVLYWRLRPHLRDIVPECQSYAVPGRTPAWNIARVVDEVATACRDEAPLAVVAIDLESAFDTLDRGFLVSTLLSVGLPPVFVGWVLLLYAGAEAAARIEGIGRTPLFLMLNGVRQGCAACAAFFTISTGPLLLRLEQLLGRDNVLAYADDIVLLIREDGQLEVVRKIFEDFRRASGIRVNFGKSQGLWCGRWRNRTDSPSAISWNREKINILGTLVTPGMGTSAQDQHLQELLERAIARWSPFVRGLSLAGRAKAANSLVLSAIYYHLQAYLPSETTIGRLQARLARFVWGHDRTSWLPSSILARPISVGGMGLLDVGTQLRLSCLKGVQAALRGGRNAHSWLAESGMWLTPASTPGIWLPPRRRRSLHLFEPAAEILDLNHRILQPALLRALRVVGDCRFLRPPELLAPTRWLGWRIGELTGPAPNITIATRGALTDVAALGSFCTRLITQNARGRYRVDSLADAIVVRGSTTAFQRLTTRTARRLLERPRLAALPITQLFGRWFPHVSIPISISWSSLRRCAFSGHNADVAVRLALHALPHPAHPASARESCIACGSGDLSLAHRYWSCSRIRPVILEAFTILQRPPDLQSWIFGHDLEDDALAIMASAKTRIYKYFLGLEMRGYWRIAKNGAIPFGVTTTNAEISAENNSVKNVSISETNEKYAKSPVTSGGYANSPQSSRNWADIVENDENFEQPKKRKRLLPSESASQSLPGPSRQTKTTRDSTTPRQPSCPRNTIEQIKVSRQMLAQCRSKAAAGTYDQMTYLEFSPEFTQVDYIKALENKLGKGCVVQIGKASGQILVDFERPDMAETIIEDGLMIKGALLKALPYQKKAEKITISGLPFVIEDADIIRTLRPYCQVVSIAPTVNSSCGYTWLDLKKTAFILMNNGKKITDLPKKIIVTAKDGSALAYLEYGFRCSKCYRMGHKRMNCPRIIRETSTTQPLSQTSSVKTTAPAPNTTAAASPPATFSHPAPVAAPAQTSSAPPAQEDIALETEPTTRTPETSTQTDLNINRVENSSHHKIKDRSRSLSPKAGSTTQLQLDTLLERLPGSFFEEVTLLGLKEEEVKQAIVSLPHLRLLLGKLSVEQSLGLHTFNEKLIKGLGSSKSIELCCFLKQHAVDIAFIQETNVTTLDSVEDLCLGYRAAVVPASGARGSGLACIFSSCVQVIGQQVLSPGKIAAFDVTIRGSKATFVNCHLSHAPDERLQQLQVIAAAAVNEDAWVLGDLNISEESASDIASGSVEALGELLDRANLVDAAAIFDATHLPTRISSCGSRVDASRLDRVLIPSSFSNRVTRYWSLYYKNSDHRAVLLQTGEASEPRLPCIASMLRSRLVVGTVETLLDEALGNIEDMRNAEIWRRWGHIKAHLASAIKSLHDLRNNDDDYISRARKYVQAKLEDVSIYSDYPSLPDLGRALRLRRRGTSSNTFYDSAGRMITGPAVRELAFVNLKERFSHPSCSPEDIDGFLRGFTLRVTIEESDPLHRYGIGEEEIVAAIGRLPTGKAAGWDDLPCELFRGFKDYFASALRRVFEASQLCGALPTSMRRSEMSLIEKPHGGPGLAGLRPLSLPTTDYRVLSGVLYWRLRPHLRDIVPECQSYAVPGRTPAWNIARVADEVATACRDEAPLAVVAIDLESAFDTLDRGFLVSTLLSVGLPPVFVGWVLLLYAGAEAAARIEGIGRTPLFHMLNGVRQGCAASAAFFTISTGPLLLRLEQLLGRDNVLAYADDIVLLIREDGQLEVVRKIFEDFRRASGIRVNFGKSQGLWCGRWRNRTDSPSAISWNREKINILGTLVTPGMGTSAQDQHLQELLERAIARWSPFVRGLSLAGRAKAANSLVLSAIYYHLQAYLPSETTIGRLQARLARFVWGHDRTSWLPSSILARPISVGGMGLLDVGTQLRLSCLKGVQAALRGGRNAHSWLAESGMWLTPASTPGIWLPPRRRRSLHLFESAAEILDLNHRILQPALLRALRVVGDCRFLRPPELLAPTRWLGWRIGELTGPAPNITIATRGALTDVAALGSFCTRLITQNARGRYRVDSLADAIVVRGSTTAFQRLTTRTARRLLERPRLAALPITQLFGRWFPHVSIPISINWSSLRRCAFSGHNADVAVRLALHALPHPAHPVSARESCIACGSGDLSLAHRYWSCSRIRPVILEAFTILQRPPDLQSWIFGHDLEDDALAIMASAKTRIYKYFLGLEMRGVQEDPLLVWRRTLSSQDKDLHGGMIPIEVAEMEVDLSTIKDSTNNCLNPGVSDGHANSFVKNGGYVNPATAKSENWAEQVEAAEKDNNTEPFESVHRKKRKRFDSKSQRAQIVRPDASSPKPSGQLRRTTKEPVTHVRNTRQQQALNKARSEATSFDQCCYVEWCADFHHVHYMKALEELLGKDSVYQLMKKSGHAMVALVSIEKAERLVENGLTINNTFLRAFPYRRKAEKIILGNLPIAVREEDIIEALRPYCRVVSLAYEVVSCNGYTWTTGNREAFVLLNEGRKLHQLPAKLVIISKGESTPAYVTYGVRCSRCHRQGHRRATCPQGTRSGPVLTPPPSLPTPSHSFTATTSAEGNYGTIQTIHVTPPNPAASSPAESCPVLSQNTPATKPSTPAPSTSVLPSLLAPSSTTTSPTADPAKDQAKTALTMGSSVPKPQTIQLPQLTLQKVEDLFKVLDADSFLEPLYLDYHRWEIEKAVVCPTMREDVFTFLSPEQISALKKFLDKAIAHVGDKDSDLGKRLSDFRTECDIERDESQ
ncbi:hypothetical protein LAZ67_20000273, partial [Cordylochernes scorpioides]